MASQYITTILENSIWVEPHSAWVIGNSIHRCTPVSCRWYCTGGYHFHDDVIKWKHFPRYWPFVRGIHRSPVNSPHKGQWLGALMFSLICVWINGWVNNGESGDLRRYRAHYDVTLIYLPIRTSFRQCSSVYIVDMYHILYTDYYLIVVHRLL